MLLSKYGDGEDKGELVTVIFNGQNQRTRTNNDGYWELQLKEMPFGGPYEMIVSGKSNEIKIKKYSDRRRVGL